jgi:hypothetical protein
MSSLSEQVAVILPACAFLLLILYIAVYRSVIFVGFFLVLFSLVWRTGSTAFIDLTGPVWSSQTLRYIGPGMATPLHVLAYFVTLAPFLILFRPGTIRNWSDTMDARQTPSGVTTLSDVTVTLSLLFLAFLFLDLLRHGPIPLFAHVERFVYTEQSAGDAHRWLVRYHNLLVFWWGLMFAAERLRNRRIDFRFLGLLGTLLIYLFITGNRFSAFYSSCSYFIIPFAAVVAVKSGNDQSGTLFRWIGSLGVRQVVVAGTAAAFVVGLIAIAIYNNLVNVRGYAGAQVLSQLQQRILIQPGELGWISFERIFTFGRWQPDRVYDFLFQAPLDPARNTTVQYLMLETIGEPRSSEHIFAGFQFAGGFPEIFFELFGPIYAWPFLFGCGYIAAALLALVIKSTIQGRYASAFLALYVLFGFQVMYIGGMLNFAIAETYWVKVAALALALTLEAGLAREGLPLVPWAIARLPSRRLVAAYKSIGSRFQSKVTQ